MGRVSSLGVNFVHNGKPVALPTKIRIAALIGYWTGEGKWPRRLVAMAQM
jgi:hypothetical protein